MGHRRKYRVKLLVMSTHRRAELTKSRSFEDAHTNHDRPKLKSRHSSSRITSSDILAQPWGTTWRKAIVSLPRAVPDAVLRFTSPDGPRPVVLKLPSRNKSRLIPVYAFIPPCVTCPRPASPTTTTTTTTTTGSAPKISSKLNPKATPRETIKLPVLLDFHGGGFIFGTCQEQSPFCAKLSRELSCIVLSVDYRLGPYARFPAAIHDAEDILGAILDPAAPAYRALRELLNSSSTKTSHPYIELDTTRVALSGFSSGGSLALNLTMSVPARVSEPPNPYVDMAQPWPSRFPSTYQHPIPTILFYPALDTRLLPHERPLPDGMDAPKSFWSTLNLEGELMPTYLPKCRTSHPRASPGLMDTSHAAGILHPQVQTFLVLPEMDTLSASNESWVKRMVEEGRGSDLVVERVQSMLHGWTQFPDSLLDEGARAKKNDVFDKTVRFLRNTWAGTRLDRNHDTIDDQDVQAIKTGVVDFQGKKKDVSREQVNWEARVHARW